MTKGPKTKSVCGRGHLREEGGRRCRTCQARYQWVYTQRRQRNPTCKHGSPKADCVACLAAYLQAYTRRRPAEVLSGTREYRARKRTEVIKFLGSRCVHCGFSDPRALQVDHVRGNGSQDRHTSENYLKAIHAQPEAYQLLCANCNWIKRAENHEVRNGTNSISEVQS